MLVRPHDRGIDGMFLVGRRPERSQRFERRIPNPELAPARKAHEDRVPVAISFGHIAPGRAGASNPKNAVDRSPPVRNGGTAFAPRGEQWVENTPFRVRQTASTLAASLRKAALESFTYEKTVNTT